MYRPPIKKSIVSPIQKKDLPAKMPDFAEGMNSLIESMTGISKKLQEIEAMKVSLQTVLDEKIKDVEDLKQTMQTELENSLNEVGETLKAVLEIKKGEDGLPGPKGDPGETPIAGVHFPLPINGEDGEDGTPGEDGEDGEHADPQTVLEHIKSLPEGQRFKVEHIDGLQVQLDNLSRLARSHGQMRGGGDTVVAGSGVTLVRNSNGTVTVSSSGGGGFSTLLPTETPNGNLTVFTFASATAQPTFIISDNAQMRATSKSGTVNWTWSSGSKQATMTVPPQDDIIGIV